MSNAGAGTTQRANLATDAEWWYVANDIHSCFVCAPLRSRVVLAQMDHSLQQQNEREALNVYIVTALLDFYGRCGLVSLTDCVFANAAFLRVTVTWYA